MNKANLKKTQGIINVFKNEKTDGDSKNGSSKMKNTPGHTPLHALLAEQNIVIGANEELESYILEMDRPNKTNEENLRLIESHAEQMEVLKNQRRKGHRGRSLNPEYLEKMAKWKNIEESMNKELADINLKEPPRLKHLNSNNKSQVELTIRENTLK